MGVAIVLGGEPPIYSLVGRLLDLKQLTTTPYHPQCNGLVERFNGTLKTMLK